MYSGPIIDPHHHMWDLSDVECDLYNAVHELHALAEIGETPPEGWAEQMDARVQTVNRLWEKTRAMMP